MTILRKRYPLLIMLIFCISCSSQHVDKMPCQSTSLPSTLSGHVQYRERMLIPKGSTLEIQLMDTSLQDVVATTIAESTFEIAQSPPYAFTLNYDREQIMGNHQYSLLFKIKHSGQLLFISNESYNPFLQGETNISITLQRVSATH